ncbi:MAG: alpha/beta hydrolase [Actinomycetota bacterium]
MGVSRRARIIRKSMGSVLITDDDVPLEQRRARMERMSTLPRPRGLHYVERSIPGPAGDIPALVATPAATSPERDILYFHGGGYVLGSPRSHTALAARLARRAASRITVIDYRLAPEHPYPAAVDDCVAAYRALIAEGIAPERLVVAGDSAGGGAALCTLQRLSDAGDPLPAGAYLLSPWTDLSASGETVSTKADVDPMLRAHLIREMAKLYAGHVALDDPGLSPLFADLAGLPPMLIQTGEDEVLLSDSTRLAERARAAGVDVRLDVRSAMWHVYQALAGFMPEADEALVRGAVFIRRVAPAVENTAV